jgi:hypothetical protein
MIMDGDFDVVFLDVLLHFGKDLRRRRADNQRKAGALGVFKLAANVGFVVGLKTHVAAAYQRDAGIGEFFPGGIDLFGRTVQLQMMVFNVHVLDAEFLRHLNGFVAVELNEGITSNSQLDVGVWKLVFLRL